MTQESDFFYFSHQVSLDDVDIDQYKELTESKTLVKYLLAFDHSPHFIIDFCKQEVMCYCDRNVTIMHNTAEVEKYIRENLLILDEKYIKTFKEYQEAIFTKMQSLDKDKLLKCSIIYSAHISKYEDVNISSMAVIKSVPILISKREKLFLRWVISISRLIRPEKCGCFILPLTGIYIPSAMEHGTKYISNRFRL